MSLSFNLFTMTWIPKFNRWLGDLHLAAHVPSASTSQTHVFFTREQLMIFSQNHFSISS